MTGWLLFRISPGAADIQFKSPISALKALFLGSLCVLTFPVAAVIGIALVGLPVAVAALGLLGVGLYLAKIVVALFLGRTFVGANGPGGLPAALVVGLTTVLVAVNLPCPPLVDVRNVHKVFRRGAEQIDVLRGVDLQIPQGDFLALMGPSGSGKTTRKTTLLDLIGGLDTPTEGSIAVAGGPHRPPLGQPPAPVSMLAAILHGASCSIYHATPYPRRLRFRA